MLRCVLDRLLQAAHRRAGGRGRQPDRRRRGEGTRRARLHPAALTLPSGRRSSPRWRGPAYVVPTVRATRRRSGTPHGVAETVSGCRRLRPMPGSILGTEVRRVEDQELLLGRGSFVDNIAVPGVTHAVFVRSPFGHARITGLDTSEAAAAEGVLAVYTADDLGRDALASFAEVNKQAPRAALAVDKVRYVGDPVALVIAETRAQAMDAVEL